ncbi:alpha/beta fold hydrolase [Deminuibacter soli]|nr:alpha/beta hydrolase [Deminuibacter soli]
MYTGRLTYRNSVIAYQHYGVGNALLVCLHGYGENSNTFGLLAQRLGNTYTVIALDMPFHGSTEWKEPDPFSAAMLWEIITLLNTGRKPISIMGFSMGGRLALTLLQQYPQHIQQLVLLAPDGLHTNPWYWLSTQTRTGNRLFRYTVSHPAWLFALIKLGRFTRLLHPSVCKIAMYYMSAPASRQLLYRRWTCLRLFRPKLAVVKENIRQYQIPVHLVFGRFDNIILSKNGQQFSEGMEQWVSVTLLDAGHQLLKEKNAAFISSLLVA